MRTFPPEPIEKASVDELRNLQLERLKWSLAHAYEKVPHYRKKFDAAGMKPAHLRTLEDLVTGGLGAHYGAEPWTNEMGKQIEARTSLDAIDIYGLSEVMGPGVAQECVETKDGLTIWQDHFFPEIVDPAKGKVLPDGEQGELVFTSLTREALPVIRYRTRDPTRLLPGTARSMRRMEKITGRSDDMLIIRGVNVFPTQIEELILKQPELAPHYLLELSKDGPLDHLTVLVEIQPGAQDAGCAARRTLD